jgi:hypothetical protein
MASNLNGGDRMEPLPDARPSAEGEKEWIPARAREEGRAVL